MRNTLILLSLVVILSLIYLLTSTDKDAKQSSITIEDREFIIEDPDEIAYFTIKNPGYPLMHFQRDKKDKWVLNSKYYADQNIVSNMLGVLSTMEIKYIPPKSMLGGILSNLDQIGIEISCFDKDGNVLSDFIMGANDNKEGSTFCVKRGAQQAYAMHVSVAEGGLRNYFNQGQLDLRDKSLFDIDSDDILSLELDYYKDKRNSFKINTESSGSMLEATYAMDRQNLDVNNKTVQSYLLDFDKVVSEAIRTGEVKTDSIRNLIPFAKLSYTLNDKTKRSFDFYPMRDLLLDTVNTQKVEDLALIERYFVFDEQGEVYIVQQRMVGEYFRPISYFLN